MIYLPDIPARNWTSRQIEAVLGQEYHVSANTPLNLRVAAERATPAGLGTWLRRRAEEEQSQHALLANDLADRDLNVPGPMPATLRLLELLRAMATCDRPHSVLGLLVCREHLLVAVEPPAAGKAGRLTRPRMRGLAWRQRQSLEAALGLLSEGPIREIEALADQFAALYTQSLTAALGSVPAEPAAA